MHPLTRAVVHGGALLAVASLVVVSAALLTGSASTPGSVFAYAPRVAAVNSTGDAPDAAPGDGDCTTGGTNAVGQPECTLRAAVQEANSAPGGHRIEFDIPTADPGHSSGVWTIAPGAALPTLSDDATTVDATTQSGHAAAPVVVVEGSAAGAVDGITVSGADITVRALAVVGFGVDGVVLDGTRATVRDSYVGLGADGTTAAANGGNGIVVTASAPDSVIADSVVSGNTGDGVVVRGDGVRIVGNTIGLDATGSAAVPNQTGIWLTGSNAVVGTPAAGEGNVVSGNAQAAVAVAGSGIVVQNNLLGLDAGGTSGIGNLTGVYVDSAASAVQVGGSGVDEGNVVSGNDWDGIHTEAPGTLIAGNLVGLDAAGSAPLANYRGVLVNGSGGGSVVGGAGAAGNVVAGNTEDGIRIDAPDVTVDGNLVGVDASGVGAVGNGAVGINVQSLGERARIGTPAAGNVASGNGGIGIIVRGADSAVQGNIVGLGVDGSTVLGNGDEGIDIQTGGMRTLVGGAGTGEGNVVSSNADDGIEVKATDVVLVGNIAGLDATGTQARPNAEDGIDVYMASGVTIGGTAAGEGNIASGNTQSGIEVEGSDITVVGNDVGLDAGGAVVANGSDGILVPVGTAGIRIGDATTEGANRIVGNGAAGIRVYDPAMDVTVLRNEIRGNAALAIDFGADGAAGVTPNDAGDAAGPTNFPVITWAQSAAGTTRVDFDLDVAAGDYRIEFYTNPSGADASGHGELERFVAATTVAHGGSGVESFTTSFAGPAGEVLTATATRVASPYADSSEASAAFTVDSGLTVNAASDGGDVTAGDGVCATGGTNADGDAACTLRAAIEESNARTGADFIAFAIPTADTGHSAGVWTVAPASALPAIVDVGTILDASTQSGYSDAPVIRLDGSSLAGEIDGLNVSGDDALLRGMAVVGFGDDGIQIEGDRAAITGNYLGLEPDGVTESGNADDGIQVYETALDVVIGGVDAGDRNVVAGNFDDGISLLGSTEVVGNYVGVAADGVTAAGNAGDGVDARTGAVESTIGGVTEAHRNVIAGNWGFGVSIGDGDAVVVGNHIGVSADGLTPVGNGDSGVEVTGTAGSVTIGQPGAGNVISDNLFGLEINAANVTVQSNLVGVDAEGGRGNGFANAVDGLYATGSATGLLVGGTGAGTGNVIENNLADGVRIDAAAAGSAAVLGNQITDNGELGIELAADGRTINDSPDADGLRNHPVLTSAVVVNSSITVNVEVELPAGTYRVEFFANPSGADASGYGEGEQYRHTIGVVSDGSGVRAFSTSFAGTVGEVITATVTQDVGGGSFEGTSEFSNSVTAAPAP